MSEHSLIILWTRVAGIHSPLSGHANWPVAARSQKRQREEKELGGGGGRGEGRRVDDRKMGRWRMKHPGFINFSSLNLTDGRARARIPFVIVTLSRLVHVSFIIGRVIFFSLNIYNVLNKSVFKIKKKAIYIQTLLYENSENIVMINFFMTLIFF